MNLEALLSPTVPVYGAPGQAAARTPEQQTLYDYGNQAGLAVLSFTNAHSDMAQVLQTWLADRNGASEKAQVLAIADGMQKAGESLESLAQVPASATAANKALGESYKAAARQLRAVSSAGSSDSSLIGALNAYNTTADQFTKSYLALSDLFTLHEVTFASSDTGSAFQFSQ